MSDRAATSMRALVGRVLRRGPRSVLLTPLGARVGNLLYFWLQAHRVRAGGGDLRVRTNDHLGDWLEVWPALAALTIERPQIGRTDRLIAVPPLHFQQFGVDYEREELDAFIRECLFSDRLRERMTPPDERRLTINVRRGDYYSVPEYRAMHGMDVEGFLRTAVPVAAAEAPVDEVVVVSDDPAWCRDHLGWLSELGPVRMAGGDALDHLATLASARRLVLANSTFSYWGAYLAGARNDGAQVVAPRFHARGVHGDAAWQHDPTWTVVPS